MPDAAPPPEPRRPATGGPLTPHSIDAVLADFRVWLESLPAQVTDSTPVEPEPLGLATLVGAFTALRHEVNLLTRATRAQTEQVTQVLSRGQTLSTKPEPSSNDRAAVSALIEACDTVERSVVSLEPHATRSEGPLPPAADNKRIAEPQRLSIWERMFRRSARTAEPSRQLASENAENGRRLDSLVTGLKMALRRLERCLTDLGVTPVPTAGLPFDPEMMEAVEAVETSAPDGTVLDELRRGYTRDGRVIRYAQVRVSRSASRRPV